MFGFFFSEDPVTDYRQALKTDTERFAVFFKSMLKHGIYIEPSAFESLFLSTAHSDVDLERTAKAFKKSLRGD